MNPALLLIVLLGALQDPVWWEGEATAETNFSNDSWLRGRTLKKSHELSGGEWLNHDAVQGDDPIFAKYSVTVPEDGTYNLWTRKFWKHGPFKWKFDQAKWAYCGWDCGLADNFTFQKNVCANWVHLGSVELSGGEHSFELELTAKKGKKATACFDAFLLIKGPFVPRGKSKPGEKSGLAMTGSWAFEPGIDPFSASPIDLRNLNETVAGESGFVRRKKDRFLLGNGTPVRFWGVNAGTSILELDRESQVYLARRLAKNGVNIVRIHDKIFEDFGDDPTRIDMKKLDNLHSLVATLKKEGIYTSLSFYFPLWMEMKPGYGFPGYDSTENKRPFALIFFNRDFQAIYRAWAKALLATDNPYTGLPLGRDPGVAIVELVNEDSYFFWTFASGNIPPPQMKLLEREYGKWLGKKYGSVAAARKAWGGAHDPKDMPEDNRAVLHDAWSMTGKGHGMGAKHRRMSDQIRFLTEHQKAFFEETIRHFRKDLGVKPLISCGNWKTADPRILDGLERYTYTAGDVIDRHGYFGGKHDGPRAGYAVSKGDTYSDRSGLTNPEELPVQINQVADYPHIISEIGWTNPNRFKAEFPFLCATYGSLQGMDGYFFFALNTAHWESSPGKFPFSVPTILGQFPATALIYRSGFLREAKPVVKETLGLNDLYDFKGASAVTPPNTDPISNPGRKTYRVSRIDPLTFYVGKVMRSFSPGATRTSIQNLRKYIDREKRTVKSNTGELTWDYGQGVVVVNTPRAQGAGGFLGRVGRIKLKDVAIESENDYAILLVVSLDGAPLAKSKKILVQAGTEEQYFGWKTSGREIKDLGGLPINVRETRATITFKKGRRFREVVTLDEHGYAKTVTPAKAKGSRLEITLPRDALYTILR